MAVLSVLFVYMWIWTHCGSLYLASVGMGMILMSLPNALFVYKGLFQIPYFVQIHILAIFLVLGVPCSSFLAFLARKQTRKRMPVFCTFGPRRRHSHDAAAPMSDEQALQQDLKFMDRNSRMIGAFGLDVIAKMVGMKVRARRRRHR